MEKTHCPHCGDIYPQAHINICYDDKCVAKENMKRLFEEEVCHGIAGKGELK